MKNKNLLSGFSSLGLIGAVSVGSLITLGYINLSHYLIAESALEQSTREAVRCVAPTDGACTGLVQAAPTPKWDYIASVLSPRGDTYGDEFDYSAEMYKQQFVAETPYYEIKREQPPKVQITTYEVPTKKFTVYQALKQIQLNFKYEGDLNYEAANPATDLFPVFDQSFEEIHSNYSFASYQQDQTLGKSQSDLRKAFKPVYQANFDLKVSGKEKEKVNGDFLRRQIFSSSNKIDWDFLVENDPDVKKCAPGKLCSSRLEAGDSAKPTSDDFLNERHLAVYVEVKIEKSTPNAAFGIKGDNGSSGFKLNFLGTGENICLGGRDITQLKDKPGSYFNLWLRGPAGANGGSNNFADQCQGGSYQNSNLKITPRTRFTPEVALVVSGQSGDEVKGELTVYAMADTYGKVSINEHVVKNCPSVLLESGKSAASIAPTPQACGVVEPLENLTLLPRNFLQKNMPCRTSNSDENILTLFPNDLSVVNPFSEFYSTKVWIRKNIIVAQCNVDATPKDNNYCQIVPSLSQTEKIEVATIPPESCLLAKKIVTESECISDFDNSLSCNFGLLKSANCQAVVTKAAQISDLSKQPIEALPLGTTFEVKADLIRGSEISPLLSCNQIRSADDSTDCGVLKTKQTMSKSVWLKQDPIWRPTDKEDYLSDNEAPICGEISLSQVRSAGPEEKVEMKGYPFDGNSTLEISDSKPESNGNEIKCTHADTPPSIEQRLRGYASIGGTKEASDDSLKFGYTAKSLGSSKLVSTTLGCKTNALVNTEGCPRLQTNDAGLEACGEETDLGISAFEPEFCKAEGVVCRKTLGDTEYKNLPPTLSTPEESAKMAGVLAQNILSKFLPQSKQDCKEPGCTEIQVSILPDKSVSAKSTYHMPLSWPLNDLLGRDSLELVRERKERIEAL